MMMMMTVKFYVMTSGSSSEKPLMIGLSSSSSREAWFRIAAPDAGL